MRWLWVDRFTEYVAGSHAVGRKGVALSEDFMHDHWECYPVMPHSLMAEGMAQTGGLLVSELYEFQELVVLAKFSALKFAGETVGGESISYRADIESIRDVGAMVSVTGHVDQQRRCEASIFFARLQPEDAAAMTDEGLPQRLFNPDDLAVWLHVVGVFTVGVHEDGTRMKPSDYQLPELSGP